MVSGDNEELWSCEEIYKNATTTEMRSPREFQGKDIFEHQLSTQTPAPPQPLPCTLNYITGTS